MRSRVAEELRRETMQEMLALSPAERMALALRLGLRGLRNFSHARDLSHDEALRLHRRQRRNGRRYSRCIEEIDDNAAR